MKERSNWEFQFSARLSFLQLFHEFIKATSAAAGPGHIVLCHFQVTCNGVIKTQNGMFQDYLGSNMYFINIKNY
jgi:hypothetical protein